MSTTPPTISLHRMPAAPPPQPMDTYKSVGLTVTPSGYTPEALEEIRKRDLAHTRQELINEGATWVGHSSNYRIWAALSCTAINLGLLIDEQEYIDRHIAIKAQAKASITP